MAVFKKGSSQLDVAISRWHSDTKSFRRWVLEDIVMDGNDVLSPREIKNNLNYIRKNLIPILFTEEEFNNIVVPYCKQFKSEYRGENKYPSGTKVFINRCPKTMSHFPQLCKATVICTYAERYGGRDYKDYCLNINGVSTAWYPEDVLSKI